MKHPIAAPALLAISLLAAPAGAQTFDSSAGPLTVEPVVTGLDRPWAFAFLPDFAETGAMLITEKGGALRLHENGALATVAEIDVSSRGQGGLLDVALARDFAESGEIYLTYAANDGLVSTRTEVLRATLVRSPEPALADRVVIFRQTPSVATGRHYGSRIVVEEVGSLFVTIGDRGEREEAQNTGSHQGVVIRIGRDGAPHPGNPFLDGGGRPEIFSYGHRNAQGAALDGAGTLWTVEHGAQGGDEVNRPEAGRNYGWPVISYGRHYSGAKIGVGTAKAGMEQPVHYWDPSIAPSGLAVYRGDLFPAWQGDLLVGALKFRLLSRLDVEDGRIVGEERLLDRAFGRIRDVRSGPDGAIWFATDEGDGAVYRVAPAG